MVDEPASGKERGMNRVECTAAADVDPQHMRKMLGKGWEIVDVYHYNGLVTVVYERRMA